MTDGLRCALITPISPSEPGNGLAHRARFWQRVLAGLGPVTSVVLPVAGPARPSDELVVRLADPSPATSRLPQRARRAPEHLGRRFATARGPFDLIVALRAYTGPFALGAAAGTGAAVVVDLDDDDAALLRALGEPAEADLFADLVGVLRRRADRLVSVTGFEGTTPVPNSVDPPTTGRRVLPAERRVLMVGNYTYAPNADGARWFVGAVLPEITRAVPDVTVSLVGPGSEHLSPYGLGYCEDLPALYAQAAVAVVPLLHGSGSRIKALEAFANQVPVVGTTVGLEGLDVVPGRHCLVHDDPAGFADAVATLLKHPDAGQRLSAAAFDELTPRYATDAVVATTQDLLREVLATPREAVYEQAADLSAVETDDGLVVMDETSMTAHHLNPFASIVFTLVDQGTDVAALVLEASRVLPAESRPDVESAVEDALSTLTRSGLLVRLPRHG